jgi:hypothetical protein
MCLIIETKKDITIPKFVMEDMFQKNNDGFGFMFIKDGVVNGVKYHSDDLDLLYSQYLALQEFEPFIHLRMKTHGDVNQENAHPYDCGNGVWLMHNGVMHECQGPDKSKSDTWYFANEYLRPMLDQVMDIPVFLRSRGFQALVASFIGSGNRIVIADSNGTMRYNPDTWHVIKNEDTECVGMRVSNTYAWSMHSPRRVHTPVTYHGNSTYLSGHNSPTRLPSKPNDPVGSFRDLTDNLWIYNAHRSGWLRADSVLSGGQEATQSPPTSARVNESDSSKNIIVIGNEKSSASSKNVLTPPWSDDDLALINSEDKKAKNTDDENWKELYLEWLVDTFTGMDYPEIYKRCKEQPDEAADFIALYMEVKIDHNAIEI